MLNQLEFIEQSIETNLFYLRTLKEFCHNVQTSFLTQDQRLAMEMETIGKACETLMEKILNNLVGGVSQEALNYQIFVTPYTLDCEELTEKLFAITINKELTKKEQALQAGQPTLSDALYRTMKEVDEEAKNLATTFIEDGNNILKSLLQNTLFSYSYPTMFAFMLYEISTYKRELERILEQAKQDPSAVISYEYTLNSAMKTIATFIEKLVDPKDNAIATNARNFIMLFQEREDAYNKTPLSPDGQKMLTDQEYSIVQDFQKFLENCIRQLLNQKAYFIIEPIFLDNMLTEVNYFLYQLYMHTTEGNAT